MTKEDTLIAKNVYNILNDAKDKHYLFNVGYKYFVSTTELNKIIAVLLHFHLNISVYISSYISIVTIYYLKLESNKRGIIKIDYESKEAYLDFLTKCEESRFLENIDDIQKCVLELLKFNGKY